MRPSKEPAKSSVHDVPLREKLRGIRGIFVESVSAWVDHSASSLGAAQAMARSASSGPATRASVSSRSTGIQLSACATWARVIAEQLPERHAAKPPTSESATINSVLVVIKIVALIAFVYGLEIFYQTLVYGTSVPGYPSLFVGMMVLGGMQLIMIGVVGEYIGKILEEIKGRPVYFVAEHDFKRGDQDNRQDAGDAAHDARTAAE